MPGPDLTALVVDDEGPARAALRHRLGQAGGVEVVGEASSGSEAVEAIHALGPQVVFLDIEMSGGTGLDVLEELPEEDPPLVVFVTAYDQYAVEAFEGRALDYVLKPVSRSRLEEVLGRLRERLAADRDAREHRRLLRRMAEVRAELSAGAPPADDGGDRAAPAAGTSERLVVRRGQAYRILETSEIEWLEAAGNYVRIHADSGSFLHRATLSSMGEKLPADGFARVHRSAIVAVPRIRKITPTPAGDFEIQMESGDVVRMSRSYRDRVLGED